MIAAGMILLTVLLALSPAPPVATVNDSLTLAAPAPEAVTADCSADTPRGCVERVYAELWTETLTLEDVAAMTARAELGLFFDLGYAAIASEAFWRSWLDPQSGACRPECGYDTLMDYLTTTQVWRDSAHVDGTVSLRRLTGNADRIDRYRDILSAELAEHGEYSTGQSPEAPSTWGNTALPPGATAYEATKETFAIIIVHHYADGYSFDADVRPDETPACSLASVIVSTEGRLAGGVSTCNG